MSENYQSNEAHYIAPIEAPPSRKPPLGTVGAIGWLRSNLFSNWLNSAMTIVTIIFVYFFLREMLVWSIQSADWGVINQNIALFNVGRFPDDQMWRIELLGVLLMLLSGVGLAIWGGASRNFFLTIAVVVLLMLLIPVAAQRLEPASIYVLIEEEDVFGPTMFVGDEGDEVSISILAMNDNAFAQDGSDPIRGLIENAPGASNSRESWATIKRNVNNDLDDRAEDIAELGDEAVIEPTQFEQYNLLIQLQLLDRIGNVIDEVYSTPDNPNVTLNVTLPSDSWYIINAIVLEGDALRTDADGLSLPVTTVRSNTENTGIAFIQIDGVETFTTKPNDIEKRLRDFGLEPDLAALDGIPECHSDTEFSCTVAERALDFNGKRTFGEYIRIQLSPYLSQVGGTVTLGIILFLLAYFFGFLATQSVNPTHLRVLNTVTVSAWLLLMPFSWMLLEGFANADGFHPALDVPEVSTTLWEGLLLTLILTFISVTVSLPLGVLLALGRRSNLPVLGTFSVLFIETIRGAPLITILFFAKSILPFFFESLADLEDAIRMVVGLTLFSAAYQAEIVRGGLQIIPKGQTEAAQALGLNTVYINGFIVLPQALRAVIPASMSQFVSLFKDTSLVQIVGLFEIIGIAELVLTGQGNFTSVREIYLYIGIIYFAIAFVMSFISRRLEETGSGAARR